MKQFIFLLILVLLANFLPAQIVTNKTPYNIALIKYLDFLSYTGNNGNYDTVLTDVESLHGEKYGRYFFKTVKDPYFYAYLNSKNISFYYFVDYSIIDIEENKITVCFKMGKFKSEKKWFFKKAKIHGEIPFDTGYTQMYVYLFECEKKQWKYAGVIR